MSSITNLVFEGGGIKGVAYAGAISVLQDKGILQNTKRIAGTSAGAITACLLAVGYDAAGFEQIITSMDFGSFEDSENLLKKLKYYGINQGEAFLEWMQQQISNCPLNGRASIKLNGQSTFTDLKNAGGMDLHVYSCDINAQELREFSYETTPDVVVAEAVRASMSIPLFFNAWQFPGNNPDDHLYVDGGMVYNYPINAFDENNEINTATLGFRLEDLHDKSPVNAFGYGHWIDYIKGTFETMLSAQNINTHREPENLKRSVIIDDLGIGATDFKIDLATKQALIASGKAAAEAYFAQNS